MLDVQFTIKGDITVLALAVESSIEKIQQELAYRIVDETRRLIDQSVPRGRVYRRGAIKARATKKGLAAGLKPSGKTRMVVGARFHRASAPGQPITEDSGRSYRDITVTRLKRGVYRIRFGGWTGYWEFMAKEPLRRRTIIPAIETAVRKTFGSSKL